MNMEKDLLILNSRLVTYNFENGDRTFNRITIAFRDENTDNETIGLDNIISINLNPNSFDITKAIKPNEYVKCTLGSKRVEDGKFKIIVTKIKGIEV